MHDQTSAGRQDRDEPEDSAAGHVTYIERSGGQLDWRCAKSGCFAGASGFEEAAEVIEAATAHGPLAANSMVPVDGEADDDSAAGTLPAWTPDHNLPVISIVMDEPPEEPAVAEARVRKFIDQLVRMGRKSEVLSVPWTAGCLAPLPDAAGLCGNDVEPGHTQCSTCEAKTNPAD